jgi:regulator of sigma E protease
MSFVVSLLVLSFLIFFHELGHFLFARIFKVKVEIFSIGFGKKLLSKIIGDTEYRISLIPLGGYVQMKGQDDLNPLEKNGDNDSYNTKKPWQRIIILLGGPLFNMLLAIILFSVVHILGYETLSTKIGTLQKDMPSVSAGLKSGDKIIKIGESYVSDWHEMSKIIKNSNGKLFLVIERDSKLLNIEITPKLIDGKNIFGEKIQKRMIGIASAGEFITLKSSINNAIIKGWNQTVESTTLIYQSLEKLITGILSIDQLGGIVSVIDFTAKASETGFVTLLLFTALFSVNLGVLNILPIPALDGGHIVFNIYELIFRKPPNEKIMYSLTLFGWILLFGIMGIGLYNDITKLVIN